MKIKIESIKEMIKVLSELNGNIVKLIEQIGYLKGDIQSLDNSIDKNTKRR